MPENQAIGFIRQGCPSQPVRKFGSETIAALPLPEAVALRDAQL